MSLNNTYQIPKDGLAGLRQFWRADTFSAFLVFLISLPFCLSVGFASHLPIISGLITAIVGGLVITFISSSHLTIKTPSMGLIPVIILAVNTMGSGYLSTGYKFTLALIVGAGVIQMLIGMTRLGNWLNIIPEAVIYGILVMIGIKVFIHQLHFLIGVTPPDFNTWALLINFPFGLLRYNASILFISGLSLFILFSMTSFKSRFLPIIPSSLFVLFLGIVLAYYFDLKNSPEATIVISQNIEINKIFVFPDFSRFLTWQSLDFILAIVIFGSLETILNVKSIDAIDFFRRKTSINRELFAIGLGNVICGFIGGLPMVSSLEDSSVNINSRAKTRWASFFYGLYTLLFFGILIWMWPRVPLASMAAILVFQAYKLVSPKLFKDIWEIGKDQFLIFLISLFTSLFFGILAGILAGFLVTVINYLILGASLRNMFSVNLKIVNFGNNRNKVMVKNDALASNYQALKIQLDKLPIGTHIYLDFTKSKVIDYNFLELIYHHPYNYNTKEGSIEMQGLDDHLALSKHPLATRVMQKKSLNPEQVTLFNERQVEVLGVASINNAKLRTGLTYDGNKLQGFKFALGYEIKYRENKFTKNYKSRKFNHLTKIEFSDIYLSKGVRLREQSHLLSVILIANIKTYVPAFTLYKEGIFARFMHTLGYKDIDFAEYPEFSRHYFLRGVNEQEIRAFFTPELLTFLETHEEFNIESNDNKILIYKTMNLMDRIEIEDTMDFAENFIRIIYQEEIPSIKSGELVSN
jgi:MFS superfamily sulfate permease-like transporter